MSSKKDGSGPDHIPRPVPKHETQELYNQWQDTERYPATLELLEEQGIHENDFLTSPVSPNRPSSNRSRSPSCASTTNSLRQAMDDVELEREPKKKRRAMRTQPLSKTARAKAAFIRKLGACTECHRRRVGCKKEHYDLSLFEAQYRTSRNLPPETDEEEAVIKGEAMDQDRITANVPPVRYSLGHSNDLFGVGQNLESYPPSFKDDPDGLLQPPTLPQMRSSYNPMQGPIQGAPYGYGIPGHMNNIGPIRPTMIQYHTYPPVYGCPSSSRKSTANTTVESRHLPIGKQLSQDRDEWECLYGTDEADVPSSSGRGGSCSRHCSSLSELEQHYRLQHSTFENASYMWRCISCGFNSPDIFGNPAGPTQSCLQPQCRMREHQRWYWGLVRRDTNLTPGRPSIQVSSQEPPSARSAPPPPYFSQNNSSTGGHGFPGVFTFSAYTNGSGSGGQYWKAASKATYLATHPYETLSEKSFTSSRQVLWCPSKMSLFGSGFSIFAIHSLISICVVELWLWLSASSSSAFQAQASASFLDLALSLVPELSLACVAAGLIGTWLFRHVRDRWSELEQSGVVTIVCEFASPPTTITLPLPFA
ncbi:hypothetical protein QBC35DRAFT_381330 [Podospora australis]|uniref:Uncharacterized protein n=1 Tax=Podospora australis TaxID=1536484 RepID=A0AAN7AJJ1_9PEZI|nr:hypothetical protein QBC35DRAFT_381330 [Podospora australis]